MKRACQGLSRENMYKPNHASSIRPIISTNLILMNNRLLFFFQYYFLLMLVFIDASNIYNIV